MAQRTVRFSGEDGGVEAPIYERATIPAGAVIEGPAIVQQLDSTVPIPPGLTAEVDEWLNIRISV